MRPPAERTAKSKMCRTHPNLLRNGCQQPSDQEVVQWIADQTGWPLPAKQDRRVYMVTFMDGLEGLPLIIRDAAAARLAKEAFKPKKKAKQFRPTPTSRKTFRKDFYFSDEWRAVRYEALRLHGARCQCCGASPRNGIVLHVDHIKPRSKHPELELVLANLQILCEACNLGKMARDETDWRPTLSELPEGAEEHLQSISD